jgi:hypothetical protein
MVFPVIEEFRGDVDYRRDVFFGYFNAFMIMLENNNRMRLDY